jgi:hypothetical protein
VNATLGYAEYQLMETMATCERCAPVENAAEDAVYTCTLPNDSRVSACAEGYARVVGGDGESDSCVADKWTGCVELIDAIQDDRAVCTSPADFQLPACAGMRGDCSDVDRISSYTTNITTHYVQQCARYYTATTASDKENFTAYLQAEILAPLREEYPNACEGHTDAFIELYNCVALADDLDHTVPCGPDYSTPTFHVPPPFSCSPSCARTWEQVAENCAATLNATISGSETLQTIAHACDEKLSQSNWQGTHDTPRVFVDVTVPLQRQGIPHPRLPEGALVDLPTAAYLAQLLLRFGSSVVVMSATNVSRATAATQAVVSLKTLGISVEVTSDATVASVAMDMLDSSLHASVVRAIRYEFRSLPSSLGRWIPGDEMQPTVTESSRGLFCASNTPIQSVTQCDGQGGDICSYVCTDGYAKSGSHICNGNFSSPHAGMFVGGSCELQLNLEPSVSTTMSLGNIASSVCRTPVNGIPPCGKAAVESMLAAQFGDGSEIVNFRQVASFELSVPLAVEKFNKTNAEGRAAIYKIKYAVARASRVGISRVAIEVRPAVEAGRRQLQTASETIVIANVTSDEDLSTALDSDDFGTTFEESFEEPIELPPEMYSELPADWGVETCSPAESSTATTEFCAGLGRCETATTDRENACQAGGCTYSSGSIRRICSSQIRMESPTYEITFDLAVEASASGGGPCSLDDEEEALAEFIDDMLFCDTCFGFAEESCIPNPAAPSVGDLCAGLNICAQDAAESSAICEGEVAYPGGPSKCTYRPGTPMVCRANMSALVGSARGDGEPPCTEQLQDRMDSWQPTSQFAGATVHVSRAAVLCGDYAVPHSETVCQGLSVGDQCNYTCAEGYLPIGNALSGEDPSHDLVCMHDGTFTGGGCEISISPPPPPPPEVAVVEDAGGLEPWQLALIIAGSATVTLAAVVQQVMIKRKRMGSVMDDSNKSSGYAVKP